MLAPPKTALARTRITRATIEAAWKRRSNIERQIIRDTACGGLALLVGARSASWLLTYKPRGKNPQTGKRWATQSLIIGTPETHGPEAAREAAGRLKLAARDGYNPADERKQRIRAASAARARTAGAVLERYAAALPQRAKLRGTAGCISPRHAAQEAAYCRKAVGLMGLMDRPLAEIDTAAVARMLASLANTAAEAGHAYGALARFFDWACEHGFAEVNPVAALPRAKRPRPAPSRDTYLTPEQIAALWKAADRLAHPVWRDLARFLLVVPTRAGLALRLRWTDLDLDRAVWRQPGLITKNGDPHRLHLPALALGVLRLRQAATDSKGLVFPSPEAGKPVTTLRNMRNALAKATGVTGWRWHDARRSFASALGEAGIPEPVADAVLNHRQSATRGGVLGVYQRAQRWPEQKYAMEAWAELLAAALRGKPVKQGGGVEKHLNRVAGWRQIGWRRVLLHRPRGPEPW
jgi:integrase